MGECIFSIDDRLVMQDIWEKYLGNLGADCSECENDTFAVRSYYWGESEDEEDRNAWHFWYKPSGLKIQWYKYPLRGAASSEKLDKEKLEAVLAECARSIGRRIPEEKSQRQPKAEDLSLEELRRAHDMYERRRIALDIMSVAETMAEAEDDDIKKKLLLELSESFEDASALVDDYRAMHANDFLNEDEILNRDLMEVITDSIG